MIRIDGSFGEGGGQILRTSLSLSLATGKPFRIDNVRAGRERPEPTPREIPAVVEQLGDHVGVFFDAGPAPDGPASSIVDLTGERPRLLREGAIPAEELERVLEEPFADAT